jgi:spermidine synthase
MRRASLLVRRESVSVGRNWSKIIGRETSFERSASVVRSSMALRFERPRVPLRTALRVLGAVFAATGAAGLLAEQCFEKLLSRLLGASTPAAAVVLAVYFLGLSVGAASYGGVRSRVKRPLRVFALLEAGVAAWSLVLLFGADGSIVAFAPLLRRGAPSLGALEALRFVVACIWILPPTLLMGMTFPVVVDVLERSRVPQPRRAMSRFYALNLVGALGAALLGPYFLLPDLGLGGTLTVTSVIDATAALIAYLLSLGLRLRLPAGASPVSHAPRTRTSAVVLALAFGSGFLFFSLEVLWTHLIAVTIGSSVYAFAAMLTCVLAGLALGGAASTLLFKDARPVSAAAVGALLCIASGLLAWQFGQWPEVSGWFVKYGRWVSGFAQTEALRGCKAAFLLLPSATVLGMIYPALFRLKELGPGERATTVALMAALNSTGCVFGALGTGFFLIPTIGSESTSRWLGALTSLSGLALALTFLRGGRRVALAALALVGLVAWVRMAPWDRLALISGGNVYFAPHQVTRGSKLVYFHEDTLGGITTVTTTPDGGHVLMTNGKFQANDTGEVAAQEAFALVPVLFAPRLGSTLVIGLGSGYSAHVLRELGSVDMDIAELAPGIVGAAGRPFADLNGHLLERPDVHLHLEDGRNWLLLTSRRYDLISIEISSVWFAGATNVYSLEFYESARDHLAPRGLLQQWVQIHHLTMDEIGSTVMTVREVFPFVELWLVGYQGIIVASMTPMRIEPAGLAALGAQALAHGLSPDEVLLDMVSGRTLSADEVTGLAKLAPFAINTDWNRYLEYATPRYATDHRDLMQMNYLELTSLGSGSPPELAEDVPARIVDLVRGLSKEDRIKRRQGAVFTARAPKVQ